MRVILLAVFWVLSFSTQAAIDTYEFKDEATRERFSELTAELRCPKCQNQNLADSNSPIAKDLRTEVYKMVQQDKPNDEIVDFMVARYGEFVLYNPRVQESTYVLWYGPFILLGIGFVVIVLLARGRKRSTAPVVEKSEEPAKQDSELSADQQAKLDKLLQRNDDK